jgi:hypothetical protein
MDRSAVVHICRTARQGALDALPASVPGRPGMTAGQTALAEARAELERMRATVTGQAIALHLHQGKAGWGLTAGPVPASVDVSVKVGLLGLVDHAAAEGGWSAGRACGLLSLDHWRAARWYARREAGCLEDLTRGGHPLHGLLAWERAAIVELFGG